MSVELLKTNSELTTTWTMAVELLWTIMGSEPEVKVFYTQIKKDFWLCEEKNGEKPKHLSAKRNPMQFHCCK